MSDLARMLGTVYGDDTATTDAPAVADTTVATRPVAKLPEWADEDVLDQAFAQWVPGPPADAPAIERSMLSELASDNGLTAPVTTVPAPGSDDVFHDLSDSPLDDLYQPVVDPALAEATAQSAVEHALSRGWQRGDDDILPGKAGGKSRRLTLR